MIRRKEVAVASYSFGPSMGDYWRRCSRGCTVVLDRRSSDMHETARGAKENLRPIAATKQVQQTKDCA